MKIKHLIITRFLTSELNLGKKIYESSTLEYGKHLLFSYMLPSLINQSSKDFTLIILINDKTSKDFLNINCELDVQVMYPKEYSAFLSKMFLENDYVIETYQDYDDCIHNDFIKDVHKRINFDAPLKVYGYVHGSKLKTWDNPRCLYMNSSYESNDSVGLIGLGLSLIINTKYGVYDILKIPHHTIKKWLIDQYDNLNLSYSDLYFEKNIENKLSYIYVRHEQNDSNNLGKLDSTYFGNKIDISNNDIKKIFGIEV